MQEEYYIEVKSHFNEPVLVGTRLGRCIGYGEDEDDCYLIVRLANSEVIRHTLVGGYIYLNCLKGINPIKSAYSEEIWDDYFRVNSYLENSKVPKEEKFILEIKKYD